ncbi:unnamed protein product [Haemonchus placei]|uniref:Protein kinase domain-containing protein n=1 Tax=Haemonchus placei TaxID=6290 RepID=A0A158QPT0_HAEPC|nr:unnamed protein product [Haemonchus placei]
MASYHYNALGKLSIPQGKISPNDFDAHIRLISQYNSSLRWLILHTSKTTTKKASSYVQAIDIYPQFDAQALVLLLRASNFEMDFFTAYKECLRNKKENIQKFTGAACAVITEMAQLFSQDFGSLNKDRQTKLHDWFLLMKKTLEELDLENRRNGEFVIQVKRRIAQVGEMHDLSRNLALAQHLQRLETQLDCLSALYNVREEDERQAQRYADPSYLWPILDDWTPRIQRRILESSNVNVVRALFFKLSISISTLCDRFSDERKNLIGRAYSYHLERRLRTILQTIPNKLFMVLKTTLCPALQRQWDPVLDKSAAREMADFDDNFHLAESTYTISNLSLGVSRMALKKVGVISINPKELLEEGIRRELALELPSLLTLLDKNSSLEDVLRILSLNLHPFQRGFIYMCEHVDVNGHDMWREEVDAVLRRTAKDLMERGLAPVGQLLLLLIMLCQSKKQHCQLHAAPLFSVLSACDRFLVSSPDGVPSDVAPLVNLLRDCGLCTPSLALYKTKVTVPSNTIVYLLLTLYVSMSKLNGTRKDSICGRTFIAGLFCLLHQINGVEEFGKTAELFADSIVPGKNSNERQLLLSYSSSVVTFS